MLIPEETDKLVKVIPHMAQQSKPRRLGIIESNSDWYLYRSVGRREFKMYVKEATQRAISQAQAAQKASEEINIRITAFFLESIEENC